MDEGEKRRFGSRDPPCFFGKLLDETEEIREALFLRRGSRCDQVMLFTLCRKMSFDFHPAAEDALLAQSGVCVCVCVWVSP